MNEWISFDKDRYPNVEATGGYLVIDEYSTCFVAYWHNGRMNYPKGRTDLGEITHWQPLPEAPKLEGSFDFTGDGIDFICDGQVCGSLKFEPQVQDILPTATFVVEWINDMLAIATRKGTACTYTAHR